MAKRKISSETKAAIMAALLEGQATSKVAADYRLPEGTVKSIRSRMKGTPMASVATQKREEIGDLLVDYVHANLGTLRKQNEVFSDRKWLEKQDADELAVLHGVITDKTIRLLEALGGPAQPAA
jgi:transposase-like protein